MYDYDTVTFDDYAAKPFLGKRAIRPNHNIAYRCIECGAVHYADVRYYGSAYDAKCPTCKTTVRVFVSRHNVAYQNAQRDFPKRSAITGLRYR